MSPHQTKFPDLPIKNSTLWPLPCFVSFQKHLSLTKVISPISYLCIFVSSTRMSGTWRQGLDQHLSLPIYHLEQISDTHSLLKGGSCINGCDWGARREHYSQKWNGTFKRSCTYSSEISILSFCLVWLRVVRYSLVAISIRWSLLKRKSPLLAASEPCKDKARRRLS